MLITLAVLFLGAIAFLVFRQMRADTLERQLTQFLDSENIAGGVVAYGPAGSAPEVLALGRATDSRAMQGSDRFRLASLSKPVTSAAIMSLVEEGRLSLDTEVPETGGNVTVRDLLRHSGGWDREITFDPISNPPTASKIGLTLPYQCEDIARLMPPAQFSPGTRYAYSNIGYCWLGTVIEQASGMSYSDYVDRYVLAPRHAGLEYNGRPTVDHSTADYAGDWPEAAYQAIGPAGGWTGTAPDYWAFASAPLDSRVTERPAYAEPGKDYYGLGWRVWPDGTLSHYGAIPGIYTVVFRKKDRVAVFLFNGRPADDQAAFARLRDMARMTGIQ
ncbi:MAG: serine hydrolase domain-containing protein [Sphingomonadaceae bacterium]